MLVLVILIILNLLLFYKYDTFSKLLNIYDNPENKRKIHKSNIPLTGGIIIYLNIVLYFLLNYLFNQVYGFPELIKEIKDFWYFFAALSLIFFLGVIDDKFDISANKKLFFLVLILSVLINLDANLLITSAKLSFTNYEFNFGKLSFFWTLVCFLLFINAFNMIDGINLQSGFYTIILILVLILLKYETIFFISLLIPIILFLYLNFKNKSFLGNSGSYLIPFLISYSFIKIYNSDSSLYADFIVITMIIPGIDLIRLFFFRAINKKNPFSADNNHLHHLILKKKGYFHTLITIQIIILLPIIISLITNNSLYSLILGFILYFFVFYKNK